MQSISSATATYQGKAGPIFGLAFRTGVLTLVTLGIYRFWAKTRIRQYIWSSTRLDGDSFEYTGTGLEKLLGFLVSVVVLAVYLAVVQLILFASGLRFIVEPRNAAEVIGQLIILYSTFFAVLPLMFFAGYRALRYRLARTRFRGIRFGMENAAWAYALARGAAAAGHHPEPWAAGAADAVPAGKIPHRPDDVRRRRPDPGRHMDRALRPR